MINVRRLLAALVFVVAVVAPARAEKVIEPLGPQNPNEQEQLGVYLLNRARSDPAAYGDTIGLDLSALSPQPPLAVSRELTGSARFHALDMLMNGYFAHVSPWSGESANQMAVDHGYDLFGNGLSYQWGGANNIESIAYGMNMMEDYPSALQGLIRDDGVPGAGHRVHLLAMHSYFQSHREIGCGRVTSGLYRYYAIHTAYVSAGDSFLTGVVFDDLNLNQRYDLYEGLGGVTVTAGGYETKSLSEGGWSLRVPPGSYRVTCAGGAFLGQAGADVAIDGENVEVDFVSGWNSAIVDFRPVPFLPVTVSAAPSSGLAPLPVAFRATCSAADAAFEWTLPGGEVLTGDETSWTFGVPGLYPVLVHVESAQGERVALTLVAVSGEDGAGEGTTAPADLSLAVRSCVLKADFLKVGADRIQIAATLTLPEGFVPGTHPVVVSVAGVTLPFTLDAKNRAVDAAGNRLALRVKLPKTGGPLGPGVRADVRVTLRGGFADRLAAVGLRNENWAGRTADVPLGFLLGDLAYSGHCGLSVRSRAGRSSIASVR